MFLRFADGYALGQPGDKKYLHLLRKEGAVGLTVKGKFVSTGGPFGPEGAPYEFLISTVVEVLKLSKEYREQFDVGSGKTNIGATRPMPGQKGGVASVPATDTLLQESGHVDPREPE